MIDQINNLAQFWWDWTSAMFWQVGLLIALIALLDRLIRRWAWPQLRYALWSLILIKLVLSPALSSPGGLAPRLRPLVSRVLGTTVSRTEVEEELPPAFPYIEARINQLGVRSESHVLPSLAGVPVVGDSAANDIPIRTAGPQLGWRSYAMSIWFLGMVTLGAWLLVKLRRLSREHPDKSGKATLPQSFHDQLAGCAEHLGLRRKPTPIVTDSIQTPAVFGLFRPVLLMPVGYIRNLSRKDTEYLLLHELAHIKRGDLVMHGLYMLLQLAYWYNPLLWLVRRRLRHLRELCCDATVADLLRDRTAEYRRTLLEAARQFLITPVEYGLGLVGLFEDSNFLIARIKWLEKPV
ncbi:MAG: M56 family metallopeptidase, partial [Planctomycetota bacterium]